jgi:glycerol-3-phosphate acyltransferase PlsY
MLAAILPAVCGLMAIVGHVVPVFLKLRGGRGAATGAGVVLALDWRVGAAALGVWALAALLTRYASVASILAAAAVPAAQLLLDSDAWGDRVPITILFLLAALVVILRHIPNLRRLIGGTEERLWAKRSS